MFLRRFMLPSVVCLGLLYFFHITHKWHDIWGKSLNIKGVEAFHNTGGIKRVQHHRHHHHQQQHVHEWLGVFPVP